MIIPATERTAPRVAPIASRVAPIASRVAPIASLSGCRRHKTHGPRRPELSRMALLALCLALLLSACTRRAPQPPPEKAPPKTAAKSAAATAGDTAPAAAAPEMTLDQYLPLVAQFNRGAALMEQYEYSAAAEAFAKVVQAAPPWRAAQFNLALAYLNMQGVRGAASHLDKAEKIFNQLLADDPHFLPAHYCLGLLYEHVGDIEKTLAHFQAVYREDRNDPCVVYKYAQALIAAGRQEDGIKALEEVVALDPGFVSAIYTLALQYQRTHRREQALPLFQRFKLLNAAELTGGSFAVRKVYGSAGKYYRVLGPDSLPLPQPSSSTPPRVVFSPQVRSLPGRLTAWKHGEASIGLPGLAAGDVDGDGDLDLCLVGLDPQGSAGLRLNDGKGNFSIGPDLAKQAVSPSFGDVDNDGDLDLWLGRAGEDLLLENDGHGQFQPVRPAADPPAAFTACARLIDVDSDGDLDLLAFRLARGGLPPQPHAAAAGSSVWNNNRDGSFDDIAPKLGLQLDDFPVATVVYDDFDNDRDADAVLFPTGNGRPLAWVNDRVWQHHQLDADATGLDATGVVGATSADPNKDGRQDLLLFSGREVALYLNQGAFRFQPDEQFARRFGALGGTTGQFADLDNDGDLDLVIADAHRSDGTQGPTLLLNDWPRPRFLDAAEVDPGNVLSALHCDGPAVCAVADFTGDGRCDLLLAVAGSQPKLVENLTPGGHWIEMDLAGIRRQDNKARSNNSAIGARVEVKSGTVYQQFTVGVPSGPTAAPPLRVHAGLGRQENVEWLRVVWPDAVLQAELELAADQVTPVAEVPRKTSSCPLLFTWDGARYRFVSDFAGVGGLGYFLAPGAYAPPDPTEYLPIPTLVPQDGQYLLQVVEPLEEVVYFDEAKLVAVDHPLGTQVLPNEMMAVGCPPPEFKVFCFDRRIDPLRATDHRGRDVTDALAAVDRRYAGATDLDPHFMGFAQQHFIELDFGDRLAQLPPQSRLILCAHGWVEYGYSATNFAASQAGLTLEAPSIFVLRQGKWVELFHHVGYPAGIQHVMTLDLAGAILPGDRKLRICSNLELYWDEVFLALDRDIPLTVREISPAAADLHFLGYPREYSPDGRLPNLYDYSNLDTAMAWKWMKGDYTRFGEVGRLLQDADDCYVVMGRGEEITLRFPADHLPPPPKGFQRSFLLKSDAFCKDMDLYTAYPDTVEPLPFHAMSGYPYPATEHYPDTENTRRYRRRYNTRHVGGP